MLEVGDRSRGLAVICIYIRWERRGSWWWVEGGRYVDGISVLR